MHMCNLYNCCQQFSCPCASRWITVTITECSEPFVPLNLFSLLLTHHRYVLHHLMGQWKHFSYILQILNKPISIFMLETEVSAPICVSILKTQHQLVRSIPIFTGTYVPQWPPMFPVSLPMFSGAYSPVFIDSKSHSVRFMSGQFFLDVCLSMFPGTFVSPYLRCPMFPGVNNENHKRCLASPSNVVYNELK